MSHARRLAQRLAAAALVAAACSTAVAAVGPAPADAAARDVVCLGANGLGYSQGNTPPSLMSGTVVIPGYPDTRIGTGDVDFVALNKGKPVQWQVWFNSLKWLEPLLSAHEAGLDPGGAYLARATAIAADYAATYPEATPGPLPAWREQSVAFRAQTFACLGTFTRPAWLASSLADHIRHLASPTNYAGDWNQGLEQGIGLLMAACLVGDAARIEVAQDRALAMLGGSIDPQGVFNEQAPGYGPWTMSRWFTFQDVLQTCGQPSLPDLDQRLAGLAGFLARSTQPDGSMTQLGDTYAVPIRSDITARYPEAAYAASRGADGQAPTGTTSVYSAGFAFVRSGWGTDRPFGQESLLTMRFGPARFGHGHFDHGSVTWFAGGRQLLVDSGHTGYTASSYRTWLVSPDAHNTTTFPKVPLRTYGVSSLRRLTETAAGTSLRWDDDAGASGGAYQGATRYRDAFLLRGPEALVVLDRVSLAEVRSMYRSAAAQRRTTWHLPPAFAVTSVSTGRVVATAGSTQLTVLRVPFPGQSFATGSTKVVRGSSSPIQGWVSTASGKRVAAPTVVQTWTASRQLTVVVPSAIGARVVGRLVAAGTGYRLTLEVGARTAVVAVSSTGALSA